ncbi:UNVERIFIED_CONTAM: hypothetical protein Slati_1377400 [Sesamum latifolium]|uniref:CCHC-type domain-containing protein n=1 Tax=Sesamum latifolium TaxID=2727402 RepID=A0AAW2XJN5_9LAMI
MQRMAPQPQPQPQPQLQDAIIDKNYEIVRRQGANVFPGTTDPAEAEEWLRNTERVLDRIECTPEQRLRYAVSLFEKDALDWWETVSGSKNRPITLTWNDFLKEFTDKYTPPVYRNRKKVEFLELKQNELSVAGYELQFVRLSKYAPEEVNTDELRRDRFERGLRLEIREKIAIKPQSYSALLEAALRAEETSVERSSNEAKRKKLADNLNPSSRQSGAVFFRGSGSQRGWYRGRGVGQTSRSPSVSSTRGGSTSVGFGGRQGSARSFSGRSIPTCANCGRRHTGECWGAQPIVCYHCRQQGHIIRHCPTWRDNIGGPQTSGSSSVGERKVIPNCLIYVVTAFNLIKEGCEAYLASVHDTTKVSPGVLEVPVVREFPDVFPEELPGLPPHREVDFEIETIPRATPISIAPYRMAPSELKE